MVTTWSFQRIRHTVDYSEDKDRTATCAVGHKRRVSQQIVAAIKENRHFTTGMGHEACWTTEVYNRAAQGLFSYTAAAYLTIVLPLWRASFLKSPQQQPNPQHTVPLNTQYLTTRVC